MGQNPPNTRPAHQQIPLATRRPPHLRRLPAPRRMHQHQPQQPPHLLGMPSYLSRCTELPSSTEANKHSHRINQTLGSHYSGPPTSGPGTATYLRACAPDLTLKYPPSTPPKPHLTKTPLWNTLPNFRRLYPKSYPKADTSAHSPYQLLKRSSAPFNLPPSASYPNQAALDTFAMSKTTPFPTKCPRNFPTLPLTPRLILTTSPAHGEPSQSYHYSLLAFPLALRQPRGTWPKPIEPSPCTPPNGLAQLSDSQPMSFPLTRPPALVSPHPLVHTDPLVMLEQSSSAVTEWLLCPNGWTTTSSSGSFENTWKNTTTSAEHGTPTSPLAVAIKTAAAYGSGERPFPMAPWRNSTKTVPSPASICPPAHRALPKTSYSPTTSRTLTTYQSNSAFPGRSPRTYPSPRRPPSLAWTGIWRLSRSPFQIGRRPNTSPPSSNGSKPPPIPSQTSKRSMESSSTPPWSSLQAAPSSPAWRTCSASMVIALSCHGIQTTPSAQTYNGGQPNSLSPSLAGQYQAPSVSRTLAPTPMPAQPLASQLSSLGTGVPGGSYQAGKLWMANVTSAGQRPLDLNSSYEQSPGLQQLANILNYSETTQASLKAGPTNVAGTPKSMPSSSEYMPSSNPQIQFPQYTQPMFPPRTTQQMAPHEGSTHPNISSYPQSSYQKASTDSSLMPSSHIQPSSSNYCERADTQKQPQSALLILSEVLTPTHRPHLITSKPHSTPSGINGLTNLSSRHNPPSLPTPEASKPQPYRAGLTPLSSSLRPHCLARDRLRLWIPTQSRGAHDANGQPIHITDSDLDRILSVISVSWAQGTRSGYGAGLLAFHLFCDLRGIPEPQRCPASTILVLAFIANSAGTCSGRTLSNYVFAIRAWHIVHGQPWLVHQAEIKAALDGAIILTPPASIRAKREPITTQFLAAIKEKLNLALPFDAAFFACITTSFYSVSRLGELTIPTLKAFDPTLHVKRSDMTHRRDRNNLWVSVFHIPVTKTSQDGEDIYWSTQPGPSDPEAAINNHFSVNNPSPSDPLFAWRHPKGLRPLTRTAFISRLKDLSKILKVPPFQGHGIRIGATLELLLRGVPFDVVKTIGRWTSEAFLVYLRQHAVVMAPYMQGTPILEPFLRYAMPPPR